MKKSILVVGILLAAVAARADLVLYWNAAGNSAANGYKDAMGNAVSGEALDYTYAQVGVLNGNPEGQWITPFVSNSNYLKDYDVTTFTASTTDDSVWAPNIAGFDYATANITPYETGSYYFYVALFDANDQLVGYSDAVDYASLSSAIRDTTVAGLPSAAWGGSGYAVPEPTSGMLLLLGMAGLALRRRKLS